MYQWYIELMASDNSELLVLSMQHESIQRYSYPASRATKQAYLTFGESPESSQMVRRGLSTVWTIEGTTLAKAKRRSCHKVLMMRDTTDCPAFGAARGSSVVNFRSIRRMRLFQ